MTTKTEVFKNFINNDDVFLEAKNYWINLVDSATKNICTKNESEQENRFDRDANPILYKKYPSLKKSIRIIQEKVDNRSDCQLGAWIEKADEYRANTELVLSGELTKETLPTIEKIINKWFQFEDLESIDIFTTEIEDILSELNIPKIVENPDLSDLHSLAIEIEKERIKGRNLKDEKHWCYEVVMKTAFGDNYFEKIRKNDIR